MPIYVADEHLLSSGLLRDEENASKLRDSSILIPSGVVRYFEREATHGDKRALSGLREVLRLREEAKSLGIEVKVVPHKQEGVRALEEISEREGASILTSNSVRWLGLRARGIPTSYVGVREWKPIFEEFFEEDVMSIHLKEGAPPLAKRGSPGKFKLIKLRDEVMGQNEMQKLAYTVIEGARLDPEALLEVQRRDAHIIQVGELRILIALPPFSDGIEITAVRPLVKVTLDDYDLSNKLKGRFRKRAEGVLIAGPPGAGKTTFTSALAEFYSGLGKIVKSLESPRDLQVGAEITQYTKLEGSFENAVDLLLLVRPDYVCFDEMKKDDDFRIYTDMRLAGIGMVGVIHCGSPIEAIERLMGRVDLGMLPHVIDTVVFLKGGEVRSVYGLDITVKVPQGMREEGLARPVVLVRDFENRRPIYEIYSFGEQIVIMPLEKAKAAGAPTLEEVASLEYEVRTGKKSIVLDFGPEYGGRRVSLRDGTREIVTVRLSPSGRVVFPRGRSAGRSVLRATRLGSLRALLSG